MRSRTPGLARGEYPSERADVVAQHAIRRVQNCQGGAFDHVAVGKIAAEEPIGTCVAALEERRDYDVGVERSHDLHSDEVEGDRALGEDFERANCGIRAEPRVAGWTC